MQVRVQNYMNQLIKEEELKNKKLKEEEEEK